MLPYWLFDTEGVCKPDAHPPTPSGSTAPKRGGARKKNRNQLPGNRARVQSYLSQCTTPGDVSKPEDASQDLSSTYITGIECARSMKN